MVEAETGAEVVDVEYVRALMDKYTSTHQHEDGDVVVLDNFRGGHARNPWDGSRRELTCVDMEHSLCYVSRYLTIRENMSEAAAEELRSEVASLAQALRAAEQHARKAGSGTKPKGASASCSAASMNASGT